MQLPLEVESNRHVYHVFAILSGQRQDLMDMLASRGIQTGIHYPTPVHLLPAYSDLSYRPGDFPIAERITSEEISLPMFPELTPAQINQVSEAVSEFQHVCSCE
jgi:dTDP-4-amino-4,6-dideoxygalactose transaminase